MSHQNHPPVNLPTDQRRVPEADTPLVDADAHAALPFIREHVASYIEGFLDHIARNGIRDHADTDCWDCSWLQSLDPSEEFGYGHYLSHFAIDSRSRYYVPSLLWNAVQAKGYRNPDRVWKQIRRAASQQPPQVRPCVRRCLEAWFRPRLGYIAREHVDPGSFRTWGEENAFLRARETDPTGR